MPTVGNTVVCTVVRDGHTKLLLYFEYFKHTAALPEKKIRIMCYGCPNAVIATVVTVTISWLPPLGITCPSGASGNLRRAAAAVDGTLTVTSIVAMIRAPSGLSTNHAIDPPTLVRHLSSTH